MKVIITIALIIVFISVFFIFLTGDSMFKAAFECSGPSQDTVCVYRGLNSTSAFGVFIIAFFVMIDILSVYLVVTNIE